MAERGALRAHTADGAPTSRRQGVPPAVPTSPCCWWCWSWWARWSWLGWSSRAPWWRRAAPCWASSTAPASGRGPRPRARRRRRQPGGRGQLARRRRSRRLPVVVIGDQQPGGEPHQRHDEHGQHGDQRPPPPIRRRPRVAPFFGRHRGRHRPGRRGRRVEHRRSAPDHHRGLVAWPGRHRLRRHLRRLGIVPRPSARNALRDLCRLGIIALGRHRGLGRIGSSPGAAAGVGRVASGSSGGVSSGMAPRLACSTRGTVSGRSCPGRGARSCPWPPSHVVSRGLWLSASSVAPR